MFSNTKLTAPQKAYRKVMLQNLPKGSVFGYSGPVTVLLIPDGNVSLAVSAIASADEIKIRRKVGEYHCLNRLDWGKGMVVPRGTDAQAMAEFLDTGSENCGEAYDAEYDDGTGRW